MVSGDNSSVSDNQTMENLTNESAIVPVTPEEKLMELAFKAREYALDMGKETSTSEFSNTDGLFTRDGAYIIAYNMDGTLLADPFRKSDIGSIFIADDYDSGQVRIMRDIAATGGGLYIDPATQKFWYVLEIDTSWWICAARQTAAGE